MKADGSAAAQSCALPELPDNALDCAIGAFIGNHSLNVFKVVPLLGAGQNLLPIRTRAMVLTHQDR